MTRRTSDAALKQVDDYLKQVEDSRALFYEQAIPLHQHEGLRRLVDECGDTGLLGIDDTCRKLLLTQRSTSMFRSSEAYAALYYTKNGFQVDIPRYTPAEYWEFNGRFHPCLRTVFMRGGLLTTNYSVDDYGKCCRKKSELLDLFPKLTIDKIVLALEKWMKKSDIIDAAEGKK